MRGLRVQAGFPGDLGQDLGLADVLVVVEIGLEGSVAKIGGSQR